ncbi:hypothetical protein [Haloglomus halophilum]|uniref:hypothetical protein n=1 Tax=Haloglomus halophilum TaxID=2962672 RepID=UPI0020CA14CA|nr:hypothetical protein [Haloglomus halophilum]
MSQEPRPEPLGYLVLAGVAVDVLGSGGILGELLVRPVVLLGQSARWSLVALSGIGRFVAAAVVQPVTMVSESAGWWLAALSALGAVRLPVAVATVLLVAYLLHRYRSEVSG